MTSRRRSGQRESHEPSKSCAPGSCARRNRFAIARGVKEHEGSHVISARGTRGGFRPELRGRLQDAKRRRALERSLVFFAISLHALEHFDR